MNFGTNQRTLSPESLSQADNTALQAVGIISNRRRKRSTVDGGTKFHYKPLDRSKGAVRLIKVFPQRRNDLVRCRIERHHISTVRYVALSYVWGSQDADCEILLNGQSFRVRPNLFAFLRHLAKTGYFTDTLFWIDAISIDQSNTIEKNHHISHMGTIYRQASKVIAWLGNSSYYTLSGAKPSGQWICCKHFVSDRTSSVRHRCDWPVPCVSSWNLLRHEYWSRLWIAQELSLARRVDVLWRGRFYSWSQIKECLGKNMTTVRESQSDPMSLRESFVSNTKYLQGLPVARYLKPTQSAPLGTLLPRFATHRCQIGHDHAFAVLSMATDGEKFEPDYEEAAISLLLRLLTFCSTSPTATYVGKIGSAIGIEPQRNGIPVKFVGYPKTIESTQTASIHFQSVDVTSQPPRRTDLLIQLPDTNLYILFKESPSSATENSYTPFARVNAVSPLVEQGRKKFASNRTKKTVSASSMVSLSQSPAWAQAFLERDVGTGGLRLHCNWQTVLSIFDLSETHATPGRLESRLREWMYPINISAGQFQTFSISKETL